MMSLVVVGDLRVEGARLDLRLHNALVHAALIQPLQKSNTVPFSP
jgi:hypothetical protein